MTIASIQLSSFYNFAASVRKLILLTAVNVLKSSSSLGMKRYSDIRGASSGGGGGGGRAIVKSSPRSNLTVTNNNELLSKKTSSNTSSSISRASSGGPRLPKARACYICGRQYMVTD